MMTNVVVLHGGPTGSPEPNEHAIKALEEWLEMARSGELIGVVMIGAAYDDTTRSTMAGVVGSYRMVGTVEITKAELIAAVLEGGVEVAPS